MRNRHRSTFVVAIALLLTTASASAQLTGTYTPESAHVGTTTITMPNIFYAANVDARGVVTPGASSTITVAHAEGGITCHKVWSVSFFGGTKDSYFPALTPADVRPNLCKFDASSATFTVKHPGVVPAGKSGTESRLVEACRRRPAGTSSIVVPHPYLTALRVHFAYGQANALEDYKNDDIMYPAPQVALTCEACPPLVIRQKVVDLVADEMQTVDLSRFITGGVAPFTYTVQGALPIGMVQQGATVTGRPVAGTYKTRLHVDGRCATGPASAADELTFSVKYAPILLASQSATPTRLGASGGAVKLDATVTSAQLNVVGVRARVMLGDKTTLTPLSMVSGTAKNGGWSGTFQAPANTIPEFAKYNVAFEATDEKGTTSLITVSQMIGFNVAPGTSSAPLPTGSSRPIPPPSALPSPTKPVIPKLKP